MNTNTSILPMTAPYRIIKHGYRIGLQIRQLVVTKVSDNDGQRPNVVTHHYPIVTYENPEKIRTDSQLFNNHDIYEETWDVEEREVSTLCMSNSHLKWQDFIEIVWNDMYRKTFDAEPQVNIYAMLLKLGVNIEPLPGGIHTVHLKTNTHEGYPTMVCSDKHDIIAINVPMADQPRDMALGILSQVADYRMYLQQTFNTLYPLGLWRIFYTTDDEALRQAVDILNNPKKPHVVKNTFTITAIMPYDKEPTQELKNKTTDQQNTNNQKKAIFDFKLNENQIKNTIIGINRNGLGEINFAFAIHAFLESINWLAVTKDVDFVIWMKEHGIMTVSAKNFVQATPDDKRVKNLISELKTIFQEKHPKTGLWMDKKEFYLPNKILINSGIQEVI